MNLVAQLSEEIVVGMDVGRTWTHLCVASKDTEPVHFRSRTTTPDLESFFSSRRFTRVVLEAGPSSPWISRLLAKLGHEVIVVDSRQSGLKDLVTRKTDQADAQALAALALCPHLLRRIHHPPQRVADDTLLLRSRSLLVKQRGMLINFVDGVAAARGFQIPSGSSSAFATRVWPTIPKDLRPTLREIFRQITTLSKQIADIKRRVEKVIALRYAEPVRRVSQVYGVGPIIALTFVLKIFDPGRFSRTRDVGPYFGLVPSVHRSGNKDPQLRISRCGDAEARRLLVQAAHLILSKRAPDSDLKRFGLSIEARGGRFARRRAVTAVARRVAVLMLALWKSGATWEPLRNQSTTAAA